MAYHIVSTLVPASGSSEATSRIAGWKLFLDEADAEPSAEEMEKLRLKQQEISRTMEAEEHLLLDGDPDAKRAAKEERRRKALQDLARRRELRALQREAEKRILDFDPKQGGVYHSRLYYVNHATFDHDEESPLGPMRFTNAVYENKGDYELCEAVNILSVKIGSSDVGFPIHVYGTVIARDILDLKCVYLFRRHRDHCQLINSEDESLILTGPKRDLALISATYIETDLKIKGHQGQEDRTQ